MKIAVLYIATGKYFTFWDGFYESAKRFLFCDREKELKFFVFTDEERQLGGDVKLTVIDNEPWPYPTLKRYHYFLSLEEELQQFDYIYFFNANTLFIASVGEILLPKKDAGLSFVQQPTTLALSNSEFGYERRIQSKAFIKKGEGKYYVWGAFNGGESGYFLKMAKTINEWTEIDRDNNIIPVWHDESYLNKYVVGLDEKEFNLLPVSIFLVNGIPASDKETGKECIHIFNKSDFFDVSFKKRKSFRETISSRLKQILRTD
jgi:hypothetical protein